MIRLLYIFISFHVTGSCFGQLDSTPSSDKKVTLGINAGPLITINILNSDATYLQDNVVLNFCPNGTITKGKSFFAAGPILSPHLETKYYYYYGEKNREYEQYRLNGFHLLYQFNIRPKAKIYNSFFQAKFIYLRYKNSGDFYIFIPYGSWQYLEYISNWNVMDFFISYGLKVKLSKNFYISPNAGIGFIINRENVYFEERYSSYNYDYGDTRLSLMVSLGLGYKFDCKK